MPFMLSVIMLNVVILSVIMLNVVMLSVIMLNEVMLSVIMLSVVPLSVVEPVKMASRSSFVVEFSESFLWKEEKSFISLCPMLSER